MRSIASLATNSDTTLTISFTIDANATGTIKNYAEISSDDGLDCDSTPDNTNGNQTGETDANGLVDDQIGTGCNPGGDEDDHDVAVISVQDPDIYDLALRKTLSDTTPGPFNSGSIVTFDIEVFNQGDVTATVKEIVDYIPTGLTLTDTNWQEDNDVAYYDPDIILAP